MPLLVVAALLLQLVVLISVGSAAKSDTAPRRLNALVLLAVLVTFVVSVIYILALWHLSRLSPGLLPFGLGLLGAGVQLSAVTSGQFLPRQLRLGAWMVMFGLLVFYIFNTLS